MKRNKSLVGNAFYSLIYLIPSIAVADGVVVNKVYDPYVQPLETEIEWRFVGPVRGGRVTAVAGDADDPLVFYFGAAHGGVWKTTDASLNHHVTLPWDEESGGPLPPSQRHNI